MIYSCPLILSALGQQRIFSKVRPMSALPPKADIAEHDLHVCLVPKADIASIIDDFLGAG
jgi:hypothetical protein